MCSLPTLQLYTCLWICKHPFLPSFLLHTSWKTTTCLLHYISIQANSCPKLQKHKVARERLSNSFPEVFHCSPNQKQRSRFSAKCAGQEAFLYLEKISFVSHQFSRMAGYLQWSFRFFFRGRYPYSQWQKQMSLHSVELFASFTWLWHSISDNMLQTGRMGLLEEECSL